VVTFQAGQHVTSPSDRGRCVFDGVAETSRRLRHCRRYYHLVLYIDTPATVSPSNRSKYQRQTLNDRGDILTTRPQLWTVSGHNPPSAEHNPPPLGRKQRFQSFFPKLKAKQHVQGITGSATIM